MHRLAQLDRRYVWHPFTQMRDWLATEPVVIVSGRGAVVCDAHGREYLDANSSIWTNLHGHSHPALNTAIRRQLKRIAHSSALGLANEPASLLAARLVRLANRPRRVLEGWLSGRARLLPSPSWCDPEAMPGGSAGASPYRDRLFRTDSYKPQPTLSKVFFSDDGSTAVEVALKLAYEFARRTHRISRPRFLSLDGAYHGDTVGAVSLGHIDLFHKTYAGLLFKSDRVMAPYCYRCPFNRARPSRADARDYRDCRMECLDKVEQKLAAWRKRGQAYAALVVEPLIQGAAGMIPQPRGWLGRAAELARAHGALVVADEVMTGFGRTGCAEPETRNSKLGTLFACHQEGVQPDFLCLAKGLTGGYLPMAATLTTQAVFDAFLGEYEEFRTFFHGHSYTANQLGAAAALANLDLLESAASRQDRAALDKTLRQELASLWALPNVGDIRQVGLVAGIELVKDWRTRQPFDLREQVGIRVCEGMARRGVLTRPIGSVVVLMPPYCTTPAQVRRTVSVLAESIQEARLL